MKQLSFCVIQFRHLNVLDQLSAANLELLRATLCKPSEGLMAGPDNPQEGRVFPTNTLHPHENLHACLPLPPFSCIKEKQDVGRQKGDYHMVAVPRQTCPFPLGTEHQGTAWSSITSHTTGGSG